MDYAILDSPLGTLLLSGDERALTGLWFAGQKYAPVRPPETVLSPAVLAQTKDFLTAYWAGAPLPPLPPMAPVGSPFRQAVWRLLREIPYGETTTYGALTQALRAAGVPASPQAVGGAVGHNPISILIPCHRVVGSGGSLTGYAGGLERKRALLAREGVDVSRFTMPARGTDL